MTDIDFWKWVGGIFGVLGTFLLKHFHGKISEAVSRSELAESMRQIATQRAEDMARSEKMREERKMTEMAIFDRLRMQDSTLARIDERTSRMSERTHRA